MNYPKPNFKNRKFVFKTHTGDSEKQDAYVEFATYNVDSHLNIYYKQNKVSGCICFDPKAGADIAEYLAKMYGLISYGSLQTRKVVVDEQGEFVRFAEE